MMNIKILVFALLFLGANAIQAQGQRPDSAGQGRADQGQMPRNSQDMDMQEMQEMEMQENAEHMRDMEMQENAEHMQDMDGEHMMNQSEEMRNQQMPGNCGEMNDGMMGENAQGPDLASQQENRGEDDRTEAGQGSEQGQAAREENSRKWWRFWE